MAEKKIFKIDAQGDTIYIEAATEPEAIDKLEAQMGDIPRSLLTISTVAKLPKGEELL